MVRALQVFILLKLVAADLEIATFDGAPATTLSWRSQAQPVMGGHSRVTFSIDSTNKVAVIDGKIDEQPYADHYGFDYAAAKVATPDVSACKNLVLNVNSETNYTGFKVSFGSVRYPGCKSVGCILASGYKSAFEAPVGHFGDVVLPFSGFTLHWDERTGQPITKCADDQKACPTKESLQDLGVIQIWAEGVNGYFHLQVKNIRASDCAAFII